MFITYEEDGGMIAWASIKDMSRNPVTDKYDPGIDYELAGIVASTSLLYAIERGTDRLYAYSYDESKNELTPVPLAAGSDYIELQGVSGGMESKIVYMRGEGQSRYKAGMSYDEISLGADKTNSKAVSDSCGRYMRALRFTREFDASP